MNDVTFRKGPLTEREQKVVAAGFTRDSERSRAPPYARATFSWLLHSGGDVVCGVLTADILWDWMYIDELWIEEALRGQGLGKKLMRKAEEHAVAEGLAGIWLWTQSWQAAPFYERLGYEEFARFPDFPRGHARVGLRKEMCNDRD
ncbi:MAG: GNAT family N-acetyltransferase [Halioglobus sp.]|nr:GNAT family N-acetyltransferase [Halioglobus sp.]